MGPRLRQTAATRRGAARVLALATLAVLAAPGCTYHRYATETPRSSTEQLLVSHAIESAVERLAWPDVAARSVAVETAALNEVDAPYLQAVAETRARALGARVVPREEAELVLLVLAGSLGTASREASFGVPSLPVPGGLVTPEIPFAKILKQRGYARLRLAAYDREGAHVAESAGVLGRASFEIYSLLFFVLRRNDIYPREQLQLGVD